MKRKTIGDVAKESGYSIATVSRVLNNGQWITGKARKNVIAAARKIGYLQSYRTVAVILPSLLCIDSYSSGIVGELSSLLESKGFLVEIISLNSLNLLQEQNFCGAISAVGDSGLERIWSDELPLPLVCINTKSWHFENIYSVASDDEQGMNLLTDHLLELGHKRIGLLLWKKGIDNNMNFNRLSRVAAFQKTMRDNGLPDDLLSYIQYFDEIDIALRRLLDQKVTAVITTAEGNEVRALYYLKQFGLRIPEDISLCGWLDSEFSRYSDPPITGIEQNYKAIAQHAVDMLDKLMRKEPVHEDFMVGYTFHLRASCGTLKKRGKN